MKTQEQRAALQMSRRLVVKIGSRVLVQRNGRPDRRRMKELVRQIARLHREGREVVVVSSGAIGAGVHALGMTARPENLPDLQMAAAVGQSRLMSAYDALFSAERCSIGQVLLTHDDLKDRRRHLNARNTMMNLLRHRIIPIVNENDVVAVDEIKFGDNDLLASLVALLIQADLLILLTTVDGLREHGAGGRSRRVRCVDSVTPDILGLARGKGSELSTGGMLSKLQAAGTVARTNSPVVIANGRSNGVLSSILAGADVGTLIANSGGGLSGRKKWIAFFHKSGADVIVDDGAADAVLRKGRSLLPIGVKAVEGAFAAGDAVTVKTLSGDVIARGLAEYGADDLRRIMGRRTSDIAAILGSRDYDEVIHRDNMVVLSPEAEGASHESA